MTNGIFKATPANGFGYARAAVVMSTQSETVFEWSVKFVVGVNCVRLGIASQIQRKNSDIFSYDKNAILYSSYYQGISVGSNKIHSQPARFMDGDVVHFRFQPQTKKFVIRLVRI